MSGWFVLFVLGILAVNVFVYICRDPDQPASKDRAFSKVADEDADSAIAKGKPLGFMDPFGEKVTHSPPMNVDGTPMVGDIDVHGNMFGVTDTFRDM